MLLTKSLTDYQLMVNCLKNLVQFMRQTVAQKEHRLIRMPMFYKIAPTVSKNQQMIWKLLE